jgi:hypothetical protein
MDNAAERKFLSLLALGLFLYGMLVPWIWYFDLQTLGVSGEVERLKYALLPVPACVAFGDCVGPSYSYCQERPTIGFLISDILKGAFVWAVSLLPQGIGLTISLFLHPSATKVTATALDVWWWGPMLTTGALILFSVILALVWVCSKIFAFMAQRR